MKLPSNRKVFTSAEVCRACGISRTSLFRLEEIGFLKPYHVNPENGYRYYDLQNITVIGQYQRMQAIGLSKKEIVDLYYERVDSKKFLEEQRQRLNMLERFLDDYEFRHNHGKGHSGSIVTIPSVTCYCKDITATTTDEIAKYNYFTHEECVSKGYRMLGSKPLFAEYKDRNIWANYLTYGINYTLCIPVVPSCDNDPNVRYFPEIKAFSIIEFGEYSTITKICRDSWEEFDKSGLTASAPARIIMHVGSYAGAQYRSEDFCYEAVIPISDKK
ncbi:MAG: MerR family transcriptional regulator [Lachnospiraceae bacterium]|nr:MerR family transcriptional regulator [Lachnospiraceae bacterium]